MKLLEGDTQINKLIMGRAADEQSVITGILSQGA